VANRDAKPLSASPLTPLHCVRGSDKNISEKKRRKSW